MVAMRFITLGTDEDRDKLNEEALDQHRTAEVAVSGRIAEILRDLPAGS